MKYAAKSAQAIRHAQAFCYQRWVRSIDYIKRKRQEYETQKREEAPQDRYSRRTAHATIAIAAFTLALIAVGYVQYREIRESGVESSGQTNQMLREYRSQVAQLKRQAADTHDLAVAAGKQAEASKAMATLMAKQFDASRRLVESDRASIGVAFKSALNPVTFHDGALSFAFSITMKNNGKFTANKVKVRYTPYYSTWNNKFDSEPMERQKEFCQKPNISRDLRINLRGSTSEDAMSMIPGDAKEWQINFGFRAPTSSEIINWPPPEAKMPQTKRVYLFVVGCVDYQSGAMTEPHQTGFIFEVKRGNPNMPTFITFGQDVRRDDVVVEQHFFGQGKSY